MLVLKMQEFGDFLYSTVSLTLNTEQKALSQDKMKGGGNSLYINKVRLQRNQ